MRVLDYRAGVFTDVTRRHRALVRKDRDRWKRFYLRAVRRNSPGLGWIADEYALGNRRRAHRLLRRELRAGHLIADPGWRGGARHVRELKRLLRQAGY